MAVNTAGVLPASASPRTGFGYLDAVLDQPGSVLALAHRGGASHPDLVGLENTLAAFRHAVALGYHYLETDVHATRDGVLLALHDAVLDRVTDRIGRVSELTATQVRAALIGGRQAVPTMAELFAELPGARFNIDIKSDTAIHPLVGLLDRLGAHDRVCVGSFNPARMATFRRLTGGQVATSATPSEVAAFRGLPSAALARRVASPHGGSGERRGPAALQVPHRRGRLTVVTPGLVRRAHAAGLHVHVWTVDEPEEMRELLDLGVDGLITDRTEVLREVLVARGQWRDHP